MAEIVSEVEYSSELPAGANIYRLRRPDISQNALRRLGGRFGLRATVESGAFTLDARGIVFSEPAGWGLRLFGPSGGWQYRHATRWQADDGQGHLATEDDASTRLALDAIRRYALPAEPALELVRVERLHVAHAPAGR